MKFSILFILVSLVLSSHSTAQTKYEQEVRITIDSVPQAAKRFIDATPFNRKIRWYKESFTKGYSIEAKTRYQGHKYSVEFSSEGLLEDIEVDRKWKTLPQETRLQMEMYLKQRFGEYSVDKLQFQYSGKSEVLLEFLRSKKTSANITLRYEVVIHTKVEGEFKRYEVLFDTEGSYVKSAVFVPKNVDVIEY